MDFTREPIIETVITPKEGCKLVVRSSKTVGQEEYFVDAVEVVTFGNAIFFRSLERPKAFIVPASDYEVLEVREARIVLKNVGMDRSIKIGGGRESIAKMPKESIEETLPEKDAAALPLESSRGDTRSERKRDRRRQYRKKRSREDAPVFADDAQDKESEKIGLEDTVDLQKPHKVLSESEVAEAASMSDSLLSNLLTPPPLISETIGRYKEKFRDAFYTKEEQEARLANDDVPSASLPDLSLPQPSYGSFEMSEEDEEEIYRQRKRRIFLEEEEGDAENGVKLFPHEASHEEESKDPALDDFSSPSFPEPSDSHHEVSTTTEIIPLPPKEDHS